MTGNDGRDDRMRSVRARATHHRPDRTPTRRALRVVALALVLTMVTAAWRSPGQPRPRRHDLHLTYSRIVVEGRHVTCRIRLFRDDLDSALVGHSMPAAPRAGASTVAESRFVAWFTAGTTFAADGATLTARVVQSGEEGEPPDQRMRWYLVELTAPTPVTRLTLRIGLLFDRFPDQKNVVTLIRTPGDDRRSILFSRETPPQTVTW